MPEDAVSDWGSNPEAFGKNAFSSRGKWYEIGIISQSKAAEIAGVSRQEFLEALSRFEVSPFQVTPEELAEELARVAIAQHSSHTHIL